MRYGLSMLAAGLVLGGIGAVLAVRFLAKLLFGVKAWDPITLAAVIAALTGAALCASILPALKASRIDPLITLR